MAILLNPRSGSAPDREALERALEKAAMAADILNVPRERTADWVTETARGYEVLVAAGGDGTVSMVAAAAVKVEKTMGIIPSGTLNHFARDAGIPMSLEQAIALLSSGVRTLVDVGIVNDTTFINNASIGAYPRMVWERKQARQRGLAKPLASALAVLDTWLELRNVTVHLCVDSRELVRHTPFVVVGNGAYEVEGLQLGKRRMLTGGQLSLYVAPNAGRIESLALPVRALFGRLKQRRTFEAWPATSITMDMSHTAVSIALDGEIHRLETPLRFMTRPRALRMIVPAGKGD